MKKYIAFILTALTVINSIGINCVTAFADDDTSVNIQSNDDEIVSGSVFDDVTTSSAIHGGGYLKDIVYPSLKKKPSTRSVLPSGYNSKVSVVENQGALGACWTFAFNAVLESALMKN